MAKDSGVKTALRWLGNFLVGEENQPEPARPQRSLRALGEGESGIRRPLTIDRDRIAAGSLQLIGLGGIRERLGDNWPRLSAGIHRLVESVLQRRLDVTDAYYRVDEESYLVLFTRLQRNEAEFKASVVAKEIQTLILGEAAAESGLAVVSRVTEIDRDLVLEKINSLEELLAHVRQQAEDEAAEEERQRATGRTEEQEEQPGIDLTSDLGRMFNRTSHEAYLQQCSTRFHPLFGLRRRAFGSYLTVAINQRTGRLARPDDDPLLDRPQELSFALDRFMLGAGMMGLHRMLQNGDRAKVVIAVNYETLNVSRLREMYFARLKDLPEGLRRFLAFALHGIPSGTPASRVAEVLAYLRPLAALHVLHLPLEPRLIDLYAGVGCYGFSTEVPPGIEPAKMRRDLAQFARRATMGRHESILAHVHSVEMLHNATAAGFGVMWGDAICGAVDVPGTATGIRMDHVPPYRPSSS